MPEVKRPIQPVVLGGDIGVYALARAFHQAYGVKPIVVAGAALGPVAHSRILDLEIVDDGHDAAQIVARLLEIAARTQAPRILVANSDWHVRDVIVHHRDVLEPHYVLPFGSREVVDAVSDKVTFLRLCAESGVPTPRSVVVDLGSEIPDVTHLGFPLIAKAASSADYQNASFAGKKKVYRIEEQAELDALWTTLRAADYKGRFLVQELIPGDDTCNRSITAYVDTHGTMTMACTAHVLLEEHTPTALGNPAAMYTYKDDALIASAKKFLAHTGYRGWANFDVKVHPVTGQPAFFEVNPRIGRNNFYVTAAGVNPMEWTVADAVDGERRDPIVVEKTILYSVVPLRLLLRYLVDPALRAKVKGIAKATGIARPLAYAADRSPRRIAYVATALANQWRKFGRHYPVSALLAARSEGA